MCHFRVEVERTQQGVATWACAERQQIEGRSMAGPGPQEWARAAAQGPKLLGGQNF
jgi:hypothetical protein